MMSDIIDYSAAVDVTADDETRERSPSLVIPLEFDGDISTQHALQSKYIFWFHNKTKVKVSQANYEQRVRKFAPFQTIEQFWHVYNHLIRPNDFKNPMDYHLFKDGISPTWEDPENVEGGKWMVRLKKGLASRYWEELVLAMIGEQLDANSDICGAVCSVRTSEDIISIWNKNADNVDLCNKIRDQIRKILKLPHFISLEYKKHKDSLTDRSSFRNPSVVFRPSDRIKGSTGDVNKDRGEVRVFNRDNNGPRQPRDGKINSSNNDSSNSESGRREGRRDGRDWVKPQYTNGWARNAVSTSVGNQATTAAVANTVAAPQQSSTKDDSKPRRTDETWSRWKPPSAA